jgi:undecaprenyl-diphosphatase
MRRLKALLLGVVEGFTEFLPVSSTGHLLLIGHFIGFRSTGFTFEILVQLGAILAILSVYFGKLLGIARASLTEHAPRMFILGVIIAFLPAAALGATFSGFIKGVLFNPLIVCCMLIAGGLILLAVDEVEWKPKYNDISQFDLLTCLKIGVFQCIAMVPGVSRSGATIVGAMLMGADKRTAAEFSFFLAMPTMAGAFSYDLFKHRNDLTMTDLMLTGVGFVAAFAAALVVVKGFLAFVSSRGFRPFAWWRIIVGVVGLAGLGAERFL